MVSVKVQGIAAVLIICFTAVGIWAVADHFDVLPEGLESKVGEFVGTDTDSFDKEKIASQFGTAVQLNMRMVNGLTGANIGDGTNDKIYIYEVSSGGDWKVISDWESIGEREQNLPDSDGTLSGEYTTGQDLILFCSPQTENKALYHMVAPAPVSPNDNQVNVDIPVYTPTSSDTDLYITDSDKVVSASANIDYSDEGSDGVVDLTCRLTSGASNAANFYIYQDPALSANVQKIYIPYMYVRTNVSVIQVTSGRTGAPTHDGTYWYTWISMADAGFSLKEPEGVPDFLEMVPGIGGQSALVDMGGTSKDNTLETTISFAGIAADQELIIGWEYSDWDQDFGASTPSGDVTETLKVQA